MKKILVILSSFLLFSCTNKYQNIENSEADYPIIPKPQNIVIEKGRFLLTPQTQIICSNELNQEANYLGNLINTVDGFDIQVRSTAKTNKNITLQFDSTITNKEGYKLIVTHNSILITGKTKTGIFYGIQSLRQLLPVEMESNNVLKIITIPAVKIEDFPQYVYRGMHLDVGRHFFPITNVKKYIDLIAMHKMNTFHWHLTEDQGWRIEIKKYPKLTEIGGFRKGTAIGLAGTRNAPYTYDTIPYGGFYTQEEIKEVVAYAKQRHITIIPEIELPGHSLAALTAYPQFGNDTTSSYEVAKRWGIFKEVYAPTEETFQFLEDVLTEVIALFPSQHIHIGGDEVLKEEWKNSKYAQELIKREDLKDEHELQSYFIRRIEKFLNKNGRNIIGWDEILEGGLAPNATVMSWRGVEGGIAAAKQHHSVIMTPGTHCYFDYYHVPENQQQHEPLTGSKRHTTVEKVYSYEPTPIELSTKEQEYILGAQGNVWTEYMPTWDIVEYKVLPRMTALSEVVWTAKEKKNWTNFHQRLQHISKRYDELGHNYAKHQIKEKH